MGSAPGVRAPSLPGYKGNLQTALPLPPPPPKPDKPVTGSTPTEATSRSTSALSALKAYRHALGLCYKCAAKWSKDHKCAPEVLHAVQDLWESLSSSEEEVVAEDTPWPSEQVFLALSKSAVSGAPAPRTVRFAGFLEGILVSILLDSGSSSSFVSDKIASQLSSTTVIPIPSSVQVAGDGLLTSADILDHVHWNIDGNTFSSSFRILPLNLYDVILGMDWLESHSPMIIHWKQKWVQITHHDNTVLLQGIGPLVSDSVLLQVCCVATDISEQ